MIYFNKIAIKLGKAESQMRILFLCCVFTTVNSITPIQPKDLEIIDNGVHLINELSKVSETVERVTNGVRSLSEMQIMVDYVGEAKDLLETINMTSIDETVQRKLKDFDICSQGFLNCQQLSTLLKSSQNLQLVIKTTLDQLSPENEAGNRSPCNKGGLIDCDQAQEVTKSFFESICSSEERKGLFTCTSSENEVIRTVWKIIEATVNIVNMIQSIIEQVQTAVDQIQWIVDNVERTQTILIVIAVVIVIFLLARVIRSYYRSKAKTCVKLPRKFFIKPEDVKVTLHGPKKKWKLFGGKKN